MRNLFVFFLVALFPSVAGAQRIDFEYPGDIVGFRFGAAPQEIEDHCNAGEYVDTTYVCHEPVRALGFEADIFIRFIDNHATTVTIQTDPRNLRRTAEPIFANLFDQLTDEYGPHDINDPQTEGDNVYTWIFEEPARFCTIILGIFSNRGATGNVQLTFNTVNLR
jgi:hypothetical protein